MDVVASSLASSDWNVYQGLRASDKKTAIPNDNLQYILNTRFNPEMTAQAGKRAISLAAVGYGNGVAEIERDMAGRVVALWPLSPDRVVQVRNEFNEPKYRVTQDYTGGVVDLDPSEVFHIRGASFVGNVGDDMIAKAVKTVSRMLAIDQFASSYFFNNAELGTIFSYEGTLTEEKHEQIKKRLSERHVGSKRAFTPGILEGGKWTVSRLDVKADDAQLIDAKYQIIEEACRWFRVPPHKIAHLLRATNNNIEHQGLEFSRDTLRPWIQEIQQEADFKLIPYRQQKFVEIDVDWASEGDFGSRMQGFSTGINSGVYSVNDVLRKLGENTIGSAGDVRMVQGAMMKLEDVGKNMMPAQPEDQTAQAWLTTVFARIQRRMENRSAALRNDRHSDWKERAIKDATAYADEQIAEMGDRFASARSLVYEVLNGMAPDVAAASILKDQS
jgi:HK97 family phage portal protein